MEGRGDDYRSKVQELDRAGLVDAWEGLLAGNVPAGVTPSRLLAYLLLRGFQLEGAEVTWPFPPRGYTLEQIDGMVYLKNFYYMLECRHQSEPVHVDALVKLKLQLERRPPLVMGGLFSSSSFTPQVLSLAQQMSPLNVLLWEREEIDLALRQGSLGEGMFQKYMHAVQSGLPHLNLVTAQGLD